MEQISEQERLTSWQAVQQVLKGQLTAPSFETWIAPLNVVCVESDKVTLETTSAFNRDWIFKHYRDQISRAFAGVLDLPALPKLEIEIREAAPSEADAEVLAAPPREDAVKRPWTPRSTQSQLNPKYTFDQFVVGNHNRFCHAAALAVAETPAQSYNPLFVYGGVGLGKTHLMQAIGHFVFQHHPGQKVKYVTTEMFTNDLITALGNQDMKNFRDRYRRIDILMIDDIQFLEGKDRTQEEIFHTFNTLHEAGKQVIISSDRPPNRLSRLEDRLRSRFSWGLIADIQPPDFETRVAILQRKAKQLDVRMEEDVIQYVAESFPTNIRELEGALNKISAYRMLTGCEIDLGQAQTLLGRRFDPSRVSKEDIIEIVAHYHHLQRADLQSSLRTKHIAHARQVAAYIVRELTDASFPQIGQLFGGRRHTTILYAYEKMKEQLALEPALRQQVQEMIDQIKSRGGT
jgi:chromosomal replication initiator protein